MVKNECKFTDEFIHDGRYQVCSCGRHLWSMRAQKIMNASRRSLMLTIDDQGNRAPWTPFDAPHHEHVAEDADTEGKGLCFRLACGALQLSILGFVVALSSFISKSILSE